MRALGVRGVVEIAEVEEIVAGDQALVVQADAVDHLVGLAREQVPRCLTQARGNVDLVRSMVPAQLQGLLDLEAILNEMQIETIGRVEVLDVTPPMVVREEERLEVLARQEAKVDVQHLSRALPTRVGTHQQPMGHDVISDLAVPRLSAVETFSAHSFARRGPRAVLRLRELLQQRPAMEQAPSGHLHQESALRIQVY